MDEELIDESKKTLKSRIINWFLIPVLGGAVIGYLICNDCFARGDYEDFWSSAIISVVFWITLSEGNSFFSHQVDKYVTWIQNPLKRFIIGILVLLLYTALTSFVILYFYLEWYYGVNFIDFIAKDWYSLLKVPMGFTLIIALVLHSKEFLMSWRQVAINNEKLISENIASQYESLKNQVNPHFLFNSLNALSSLVYSNQDKAVQFIRKLSEVYRYVLDHQMDEVVSLREEMEFVESFVFLNKIRFGENLNVSITGFDKVGSQYMIPPLTVQMLLENCFKHNVVSKENHLNVDIYLESEFVVIKNNINLKKVIEHSSGLGLKNIQLRYGFLTEKQVEVIQDSDSFEVKIPLLTSSKK